ncbi:hypothetical protein ACFPRL_05170 [Pseudoclavibacter helvolus]
MQVPRDAVALAVGRLHDAEPRLLQGLVAGEERGGEALAVERDGEHAAGPAHGVGIGDHTAVVADRADQA